MKKIEVEKIQNLKYSNIFLFERREKERKLSEENKRKNSFLTITTQKKNNSEYPFLSNYITLTTMNTSIRPLSRRENRKKLLNKNIIINNNINFSRNTFNNNSNNNIFNYTFNSNFYLTETPFKTIQTERNLKNKVLFNLNNNSSEKKTKEKNSNILTLFESKNNLSRNKSKKHFYSKTLINFKLNKLKEKKECKQNTIKKTREIILNKYTIDIKKERTIRLKEINENNYERIENVILSMKKNNKLFNEKFIQKFNDYIRELTNQREIEKEKNNNLIEEILKQKNEISQIENQIKKILYEKHNIVRWIFFQILVKEKKINLPSHYKLLIEETEENITKIFSNPSNFSSEENIEKKIYKRQTTKKIYKRRSTRKSLGNLDKLLLSKSTFINTYKNISLKEAQRIRSYKYNLIFSSPEEFLEKIKKFEIEIIKFIDEYNQINLQIKFLKKEKEEIEKENYHELKIENEDIEEKEIILKNQKKKFEFLNQEIQTLKIFLQNSLLKTKIKRKNSRKSIFDTTSIFSKKKNYNLYNSIMNLYQTCSQININQIIENDILIIRKINSKESEILGLLSKIEIIIDYLISKIQFYQSQKFYFQLYKKIQSDIEKNKKIEKTKKQKEEESKKLQKLKEKIQIRDNKIYFLPRKKFQRNFSTSHVKKSKKFIYDPSILNINFNDLIFQSDEDL